MKDLYSGWLGLVVLAVGLLAPTVAGATPIAQWPFDSGYADASGNGNNLSLGGGSVPFVPGAVGNGASFDGVSGYLVGSSAALLVDRSTFSIGAWVFIRAATGFDAGIIGADAFHYGMTYHNDGRVYAYVRDGADHASSTITLNAWHALIETYDGTTIRIYIDGALAASGGSAATTGAASAFYVGRETTFLNGIVDNAFFDSAVISAQQIATFSGPEPPSLRLGALALAALLAAARRAG